MSAPPREPARDAAHAARGAAEPGWEALMQAAQSGDQLAYRSLLQQLHRWLCGYYARRLAPDQVDDAAQDALIALHEKRHTYRPGEPLRPWLAAIARYKWIDRLRAMRAFDALDEHSLPATDHTERWMSAIVLERLLARIKPAQATAIRLVKLQGCSIAEASQATGQSPSLVKVNIHRGMAALMRAAAEDDGADGSDAEAHAPDGYAAS